MEEVFQAPQGDMGGGSETMLAPQEVQRMLALQALGWGGQAHQPGAGLQPQHGAAVPAARRLAAEPV